MFTVNKFLEDNRNTWENFVKHSNNGTIFHLRKFIDYHEVGRFEDYSLEFFKNNSLFSVFPASLVKNNKKKILVSHPGTTIGSFVLQENLSIQNSFNLVESLVKHARENNFNEIRLTLPPITYLKRPSNYIDFSLLRNGFKYLKREVSSTLYIGNDSKNILNKFRPSHARAARKSQSLGVEIRQSKDIDQFYKILENNLNIRHGVNPTHTLKELHKLLNLFPSKINLFAAFYNGEMIAGALNFIINNNTALAFYISHKEQFQELRPLNLLFYSIFKWCIKEKIRIYDFGTFTDNGEPNIGLGRFKENFGASGIFRDSFQILF